MHDIVLFLSFETNRVVGLCLIVLQSWRVHSPQSYHNTQFREETVFISQLRFDPDHIFVWRNALCLFTETETSFEIGIGPIESNSN